MQTRYIWRMKSLPGGAKRLYDLVRINTKIFFWIWNSFIHVLASNYVMLHVPDLKSPLAHFHRLFYLWLFDLLVYFWLLPPKDFHPKCLLLEFALSIESITICKQDQVDNNNNFASFILDTIKLISEVSWRVFWRPYCVSNSARSLLSKCCYWKKKDLNITELKWLTNMGNIATYGFRLTVVRLYLPSASMMQTQASVTARFFQV